MDEFDQADSLLDAGEGAKALEMFRRLADRGRVSAMHSIAHTYLYGIAGVPRDYDAAFTWFTRAADHGCPQAMYHLGLCNAMGYGTPKNPELALRWYKESAARNDEDAEYRVGWCHENGIGTERDVSEARKWYRLAASHGQAEARERLETLNTTTTRRG